MVGLAVAEALARNGADVTVLEQHTPGSGTSNLSYGWINSNNKIPESYFDLNRAGLESYRRCGQELNGAFVASGHLEIATDPGHAAELDGRVRDLQDRDYPAALVSSREARRLEPDVVLPGSSPTIAHFADEGYCHLMPLIATLRVRAVRAGSTLSCKARVIGIDHTTTGVRVRIEGEGSVGASAIDADAVISCTGRWSENIAAMIGKTLPLVDAEGTTGSAAVGFLGVTQPVPATVSGLITSPELNIRPHGGGRLMLQALDLDDEADPRNPPDRDSDVAAEFLARLVSLLPVARTARLEAFGVGQRALPVDGLTAAGWLDEERRVYAIATHSGVTLALLLARLAVTEVMNGQEADLLSEFRPGRFWHGKQLCPVVAPRQPGQQ